MEEGVGYWERGKPGRVLGQEGRTSRINYWLLRRKKEHTCGGGKQKIKRNNNSKVRRGPVTKIIRAAKQGRDRLYVARWFKP